MVRFADATVASLIRHHAEIQSESPAIVASGASSLTYSALAKQIRAFGRRLRDNGVPSSAKVAILLPNGPELAVALVATVCNAIAVPLNPNLTASELDQLFSLLGIDAIVVSDRVDHAVREVAARHGIGLLDAKFDKSGNVEISGTAAMSSFADDGMPLGEAVNPDAPAFVLRTSASTGRPKLVPVTHRNLTISAYKRKTWFAFTEQDRALCVAPLYYGQALKGVLFTPLLLGGSVAFPDQVEDDDILSSLVDLQPTFLDAGPTFYMNLLDRVLARGGAPLHHSLRFLRSGAAPLSLTTKQRLEEIFGVPVLEGYGLTETGTIAANSISPEHRKPGTVGRPSPQEVAIRAEDGRLLPPGARGEIVVRGPAVMPGYLHNEEANRAAFVDGWFLTGDLGSIDAEGFLTYLGRRKEFISRGGEKVSLYEVEQALLLHPSVRDAAAFPVPHPRLGENVAAAVVLLHGATMTPTEIKAFLADHLASFKIPHHVMIMPELPKGVTGKTLRQQLSEAAVGRNRDVTPPDDPLHFQIMEIWQKVLGRSDVIGIDEDFFEAGGDSLLAVRMVCEIEAITRQPIPPSALRSAYTVRELADAIVRGIPTTHEIVTRARDGNGTPFLFCHGDYMTRGFYALKLADKLTGDQPVYLLHPDPNPDSNLTIEEMVQSFLPHVLTMQPAGPIRVGGYCHGGLLAWEIAYQLERIGREVEAVVLVDTISHNARFVLRAIARCLGTIGNVIPERMSKKMRVGGMPAVWRMGTKMRAVWRTGEWFKSNAYGPYSRAMANYIPPSIKTRVLSVICEESRTLAKFSTPWTHLASDARCDYVPGTHASCITTYVSEVTDSLDKFFSSVENSNIPQSAKNRRT